ncbi:MAG TPA: anti-sigma factor [Thermoanaerobaculia bacterium]|nr:anti-sigma factor [Thermoanaerobaculia bacterium]
MTEQHPSRYFEMLPGFALGAMEGEEMRELQEHVATGCPTCRRELLLLAGDLEALADAVEPLAPSAALRDRLLARLPRAGQTPSAARRTYRLPFWLAAAALLLVAVWGIERQATLGEQLRRLTSERDQLAARADALARQVTRAQAQAERMARTLAVVAAPSVQAVRLAGKGPASSAAGRTYVDAARRKAVFYAYDLPALSADQTYQLWFIDDASHPTSAGTFGVDRQGKATLEVENLLPAERIRTWAVTIEPRGGVPQPTGPMVLVS